MVALLRTAILFAPTESDCLSGGRMHAGGPARRSGDRCPRGQARRHHGQALNACASVQAPQAATEVPAHAAWPRHPRPSPQDHIARRPPGPATRSRVACAPSRAASARTEDPFVARPEVECIGRGKARAPYEFGCKVSIVTPVTAPKGGQFALHAKALHGQRPCPAHPSRRPGDRGELRVAVIRHDDDRT